MMSIYNINNTNQFYIHYIQYRCKYQSKIVDMIKSIRHSVGIIKYYKDTYRQKKIATKLGTNKYSPINDNDEWTAIYCILTL